MSRLSLSALHDVAITVRPKVLVAVITSAMTLAAMMYTSARYIITRIDWVEHSVQDTTFARHLREDSSHHALQDSVLSNLAKSSKAASDQTNRLTCHVYGYPRPYCDEYRARPAQAGVPVP